MRVDDSIIVAESCTSVEHRVVESRDPGSGERLAFGLDFIGGNQISSCSFMLLQLADSIGDFLRIDPEILTDTARGEFLNLGVTWYF